MIQKSAPNFKQILVYGNSYKKYIEGIYRIILKEPFRKKDLEKELIDQSIFLREQLIRISESSLSLLNHFDKAGILYRAFNKFKENETIPLFSNIFSKKEKS